MIDTFPLTDTGDVLTEDPNFAVVSLRQGADATQKCTVSLKIFSKQDLNKIENIEVEDWMSQSDPKEVKEEEESD